MKKLSILLLLVFSVTSQAQLGAWMDKKADQKAAKARANAPDKPTDGVTSPMHQKYMGKVVFCATEDGLMKAKEDETKFTNKFTLGDPLVFRVYMANSLGNYLKSQQFNGTHGRYWLQFTLDDTTVFKEWLDTRAFSEEEKNKWTTWKGALKSPDGENFLGIMQFNAFVKENEAKLMPGDHKLKIEILPYQDYPEPFTGPVVATGELTMTVKNSVVDKNDARACLPKAVMTDKALEAKILAAFKAQGWKEVPKEVRITSKWTIVRNEYTGVILSRYVEAYIGSTRDGKCLKQSFNFHQDHDGSGFMDDVYLKGIGSQYDIPCGCMKP
ncbi:hypothetical protein [Flavobacterium silvaticum]|uniref:Uncharacterized protein n=1 Tax=Flavobacterium silvaticum TaxID=1852020 RepID=A0A972FPV4_9FLAO|nr:hypothetical protein [Flavobacterium silvaticum]NMH27214.1 hypothetical protein [Flavobacterium silvaticum]